MNNKPETLAQLQQWLEEECYNPEVVTTDIPSPIWGEVTLFGKSNIRENGWFVSRTTDYKGSSDEGGKMLYRIFVFGRDVLKLDYFKK